MVQQQIQSSHTSLQGASAYNEYFPKKPDSNTGSHMPWMDRHQRTWEKDTSEGKGDANRSDPGAEKSNRGRILGVLLIFVLLIIVAAIVLVLVYVFVIREEESESKETEPVEGSFIATYDASMAWTNEIFSGDLNDPDSARYQQLTNVGCQQVDDIFRNTEGYSECEGRGFSAGTVIFRFRFSVMYDVTASVVLNASDGEKMNAIKAALKKMRDVREPQLRTTFVNNVNSNSNLGNAQIDTLPENDAIIPVPSERK